MIVTETEVFRTTYTNLEQMVIAAEHVLFMTQGNSGEEQKEFGRS